MDIGHSNWCVTQISEISISHGLIECRLALWPSTQIGLLATQILIPYWISITETLLQNRAYISMST